LPTFERSFRPQDAGAAGALATTTGTVAFATPGSASGPGFGERLGGRLVAARGGWLASLGLGAIFAIGWTPCVGTILGGILGLAASSDSQAAGAVLLAAYTLGLGVPFIILALLYDRAPGLIRPLLRHGRAVSVIGGILVALIGVAMLMNWLVLLSQLVPFNTRI
jgi:cytochrome c biogenesis protein CcdA